MLKSYSVSFDYQPFYSIRVRLDRLARLVYQACPDHRYVVVWLVFKLFFSYPRTMRVFHTTTYTILQRGISIFIYFMSTNSDVYCITFQCTVPYCIVQRCLVWCGAMRCGKMWCGVLDVVRCGAVRSVVVCCAVWCGVS